MDSISFDQFKSGLDLRKSVYTAGADAMRQLLNCYVNTGHEIVKRPGQKAEFSIEPGTAGLASALGKMNTFSSVAPLVSHGDSRLQNRLLPLTAAPTALVTKIHFCKAFANCLYVIAEYDNDTVMHHWLNDSTTWSVSTTYATTGVFVKPSTYNGFRYEATATSGTGGLGGAEPTWPTTVGSTVVQGGGNSTTWTCRSNEITDTNCPTQSKSAIIIDDHIFSPDTGGIVRICAVRDARDWTTANNAGFIDASGNQNNAGEVLGLGEFKKKLVVYFYDSLQTWNIDPDPSLMTLAESVYNSGSPWPRSSGQVSQDTFYLSAGGFRSIELNEASLATNDNDVGSPIDVLVRASLKLMMASYDPVNVLTDWVQDTGQYMCIVEDDTWAYAFSSTGRVAAWSEYLLGEKPSDMTMHQGTLYMRSGDVGYAFDLDTHADNGNPAQCIVEFPLVDCKSPGTLKMFQGMDYVGSGTVDVAFKYIDDAGITYTTDPVTVSAFTPPGALTPVEVCAVAIAPIITHQANEPFSLARLSLYYQQLGAK